MNAGLQERVTRNVKVLMALRGISDQKTLAARLGWGADRVSTSFSGRRRWALDDLVELAAVFDLRPGDLLSDPAELVNVQVPARTGTDSAYARRVTTGVTSEYVPGNTADVIQFPQVGEPRSGYYLKRDTRRQRLRPPGARRNARHPFAAAVV